MPLHPTVEKIIAQFNLKPLPVEGGLFCQTWRASEQLTKPVLPERYKGEKPFGTAILMLLTDDADSFSALHKLPTDEVYHFYLGDPIEMLHLHPDGRSERVILGQNIFNQQHIQYVTERDIWQGFHLMPGGSWALLGTTMAPGFTNADFILGERQELLRLYPQAADLITALTRPLFPGGYALEQ